MKHNEEEPRCLDARIHEAWLRTKDLDVDKCHLTAAEEVDVLEGVAELDQKLASLLTRHIDAVTEAPEEPASGGFLKPPRPRSKAKSRQQVKAEMRPEPEGEPRPCEDTPLAEDQKVYRGFGAAHLIRADATIIMRCVTCDEDVLIQAWRYCPKCGPPVFTPDHERAIRDKWFAARFDPGAPDGNWLNDFCAALAKEDSPDG